MSSPIRFVSPAEFDPGTAQTPGSERLEETVAYMLAGVCEVRWGANGAFRVAAKAGDFIHVPAHLPHMESNPSATESFHWVVVRSTLTPIVVNLPADTWT